MAKKQFKAESKRLMELMINSIYTDKDIFLREIISNASDAQDKLCYTAFAEGSSGISREDLEIRITIDKAARIITVSDKGIGMTKEELESNLGTIARSGSRLFKDEMDKMEEIDIIGQFGVGFYSAFMVADKVTVITRRHGSDEAWKWVSTGVDGYTVTQCEKDSCGTEVIMHIKEDTEEERYSVYLEQFTVQNLVKRYSDYIRYPIRMLMMRTRRISDSSETEARYEDYTEDLTLNSMVPIWQRSKSEVTKEELESFYQEKFMRADSPAATINVSAEGTVTFKALLFIPGEVPYDYFTTEYKRGLQLYSSGVMIMDSCEELVPEHFRFVRGVVDTQDVTLNISRQTLQHDRQVKVIANNLEKKIRAELKKMMDNSREDYEKFFSNFGIQLKYGILSSYGMAASTLKDLLLYYSSTENKLVSLQEYVDRMPEGQEYIYYACGEDTAKIDKLPQTEIIRQKGWEMLYLTEKADEFVIQSLGQYADKPFRSVNDSEELLGDEAKEKAKKDSEENAELLDFVRDSLEGRIVQAKISAQLVSTPACLTAQGGISFEMEKYFASFKGVENEMMQTKAQRVLQINSEHPAFDALSKARLEDPERAKKLCRVLYDQACLMADLPLEDPAEYSKIVCELIF